MKLMRNEGSREDVLSHMKTYLNATGHNPVEWGNSMLEIITGKKSLSIIEEGGRKQELRG